MGKKCLYCKSEIADESLVDFCDVCGSKVWGEKMLEAIKENMKKANLSGSLSQGFISIDKYKKV